jgi:hypothetical protein
MAFEERRRYSRYDTELKVYFRVNFELKTKVEFQLIDKEKHTALSEKHSAVSRNVSAEGLCFTSNVKLMKGDVLSLEVYLPSQDTPIYMEGEVRWSQETPLSKSDKKKFSTGIKILNVEGRQVDPTIFYDAEHNVIWSVVLDSVFGSFKKIVQKTKNLHQRKRSEGR